MRRRARVHALRARVSAFPCRASRTRSCSRVGVRGRGPSQPHGARRAPAPRAADCCDGSDEPAGLCNSTCDALGASRRAELRAQLAAAEQGLKTRTGYVDRAAGKLQGWREDLARLESELVGLQAEQKAKEGGAGVALLCMAHFAQMLPPRAIPRGHPGRTNCKPAANPPRSCRDPAAILLQNSPQTRRKPADSTCANAAAQQEAEAREAEARKLQEDAAAEAAADAPPAGPDSTNEDGAAAPAEPASGAEETVEAAQQRAAAVAAARAAGAAQADGSESDAQQAGEEVRVEDLDLVRGVGRGAA